MKAKKKIKFFFISKIKEFFMKIIGIYMDTNIFRNLLR